MIQVEVTLTDSIEIWNLPGVANLCWQDNNLLAMQIVFDDLKRRAACEGLNLIGFQICARNPAFSPMWNEDLEHWL